MSNTLGAFIRAQRERTSPSAFGLAEGRRRTPGLRREELAGLCGVSATWLAWLEQGRPVSASAKTLARLATVLKLSQAERKYLFKLADKVDPEGDVGNAQGASDQRAAGLIVDAVKAPAYVLDRQWNAIASNAEAGKLFAGWLVRGTAAEPNLLRYMFEDPAARQFVIGWEERARRIVAEFRADCGKAVDTPPLKDMVDELLKRSADFRKYWESRDVVDREGGLREFQHPVRGRVSFNQMTFQPHTRPDWKLVILLAWKSQEI
ncbi:MAG TPA: helix-turn-helix transcriptional regulator [Noviherbaspirillum sp.]